MNKKNLNKLFSRSIKQTRSRFISIFCIVFLGAAFFAGLRNAPTTMRNSMDIYFTNHNFPDLTLISTLGFNEEDVQFLDGLDETKEVKGSYRADVIMKDHLSTNYDIIAHSLNHYFNSYEIKDGRDVQKKNEILVDDRFGTHDMLGKEFTVENDYGSVNVKVVGIINSPQYIVGYLKGTNSYTNQTNDGYIYMSNDLIKELIYPEELYDLTNEKHLYNEILIEYNIKNKPSIFDDSYDEKTKLTKVAIEDAINNRLRERRNDIVERLNEELEEPLQKYEDGLEEYTKGKEEYDLQIADAKMQIVEGKLKLLEYTNEAMSSTNQIDQYDKDIQNQINEMRQQIQEVKDAIHSETDVDIDYLTQEQYDKLHDKFGDELPSNLELQILMIENRLSASELIAILEDLDPSSTREDIINAIQNNHTSNEQSISDRIDDLLVNLDKQLLDLSNLSTNGFSMIDGLLELEKANLEIEKNEALIQKTELTTGKELEDAKIQLDEAKIQLDDAKDKIDNIPNVTLYSLTHNENYGAVSYSNDSSAIEKISYVIPIVFFAVAALVTLTTMTRMVEEQRGQTGILRALGYTKLDVLMYYFKYVILATVPATIVGILFGTFSLAFIIYYLYTTLMYSVTNANVHFVFGYDITLLSFLISVGLTLLITAIVVMKELNANTATLMRPKTMKAGKRVILENIPFIWKRLSFNQKVTVRNVFRNMKRASMSIIGIAGCSALLVIGVGIKMSISQILDLQFDKIWSFDTIVTLDQSYDYDKSVHIQKDVQYTSNINETVLSYVASGFSNSDSNASDKSTNLVVINDRSNDLIKFYDAKNTENQIVLDDNGVFIYQKLAEDLGVDEGDSFSFTYENQIYTLKVNKVIEGFTQNYVYMSSSYYEKAFEKDLCFNTIYASMKDNDASLEDTLTNSLYQHDEILTVQYTRDQHVQFDEMLKSLNYIILIITAAAALLAFVVLYNLTNINIQERVSEIATLKVLGFYPKETYDYIFKENTILGFIGTFIGLFLGTYLHRFIILLVETEAIMFKRELNIYPYLFSIVLSIFFIELINYIMRSVVNKVKMVESLKSVE